MIAQAQAATRATLRFSRGAARHLFLNPRPSIAMTSTRLFASTRAVADPILCPAAGKLQPPQAAPRWNHTPEQVTESTTTAIAAAKASHDGIAALDKPARTFESVFRGLADVEATLSSSGELLTFYQHVSTNKDLRDAAAAAEVKLNEFDIDTKMRVDLFEAAKDAQAAAGDLSREPEQARLADKIILDGKRNGLDLPEDKRKELENLKKELSGLCVKFQKTCNEGVCGKQARHRQRIQI